MVLTAYVVFAVRNQHLSSACCRSLTGSSPALQSRCAQNAAASTASLPYVCDDHDTPLLWGGMGEVLEMIWGVRKQKYFCNEDWTTQISLRKHNKSPRTRNDIDGYRFRSTDPKRCPTGKSPLCGERTLLVSRTRRSAISAFTRVYDALWRCAAEPGPNQGVNPLIQTGRPTSALKRKTDSSRTSRQVRKPAHKLTCRRRPGAKRTCGRPYPGSPISCSPDP
jgi:hypothetical protein